MKGLFERLVTRSRHPVAGLRPKAGVPFVPDDRDDRRDDASQADARPARVPRPEASTHHAVVEPQRDPAPLEAPPSPEPHAHRARPREMPIEPAPALKPPRNAEARLPRHGRAAVADPMRTAARTDGPPLVRPHHVAPEPPDAAIAQVARDAPRSPAEAAPRERVTEQRAARVTARVDQTATEVHVHIGRIEVRSGTAAPVPAKSRPRRAGRSLDDYMAGRRGPVRR